MELESAVRIANQFIIKIQPACGKTVIAGDIAKNNPKIKNVEVNAQVSNRKLLDSLLLECSTPIQSSEKKLVRLYQNVKVIVNLS